MKKDIQIGLGWAGAMILLALAAVAGRRLGLIDHDAASRVLALNGLMIAYYGNLAPKKVVPSACARQAARVGGWSMVLSGLAYAILWAFAPIPVALTFGTGAVAFGLAVTIGYCFRLRSRAANGQAV